MPTPGLVIAVHGNRANIELNTGKWVTCPLKRNASPVIPGDVVSVHEESAHATIESVSPRTSELWRGLPNGKRKLIAANLTHMVIVVTAQVFSEFLIDSYLCASWMQSLSPILILNKIDLMNAYERADFETRLAPYRALDLPIFEISALNSHDLEHLANTLSTNRSVLVGTSGVGKTTLTNQLTDQTLRTQPVLKTGAGKHTTTAATLYRLSDVGFLIDSPGVHDFELWPISEAELQMGFPEFTPFLSGCRFRDCKHQAEPDCRLKNAVNEGTISASRYHSYKQLYQQIVHAPKTQ